MTKKRLLYLSLIIFVVLLAAAAFSLGGLEERDDETTQYNTTIPKQESSYSESRATSDSKLPHTKHLANQNIQQMIYNANLYLYVTNVQVARNKLEEVAKKTKSNVVTSVDTEKNQNRFFTITYRVPQGQFQTFIDRVKKISNSAPSVQIQGQDVSEEVVDLEARLKAKQAMESRLLDMMKQATTTNDLLDIENTLGSTQEQIEQLKGRLQYLHHRIDYSTVSIEITQSEFRPVQENSSIGREVVQGFISSTKDVWTGIQLFIILLARILPFIIVLSIIGYSILLFMKKRRKK